MIQPDLDKLGALVKRILASWPAHAARIDTAAMTIAYSEGLADLDHESALRAVKELAKTEVYIPAIATIRARAVAYHHGERRSGMGAWAEVVLEVRRAGRERRPQLADPIAARVVSEMGWPAICNAREGDPSTRARFCERYDELAAHEYRAAQLAPGAKSKTLPARAERTRKISGLVRGLLGPVTNTKDDNMGDDE